MMIYHNDITMNNEHIADIITVMLPETEGYQMFHLSREYWYRLMTYYHSLYRRYRFSLASNKCQKRQCLQINTFIKMSMPWIFESTGRHIYIDYWLPASMKRESFVIEMTKIKRRWAFLVALIITAFPYLQMRAPLLGRNIACLKYWHFEIDFIEIVTMLTPDSIGWIFRLHLNRRDDKRHYISD